MIADRLVTIAAAEVGVTEVAGTNCGPRVNQYKGATVGLDPSIGWPWCAAFVCWCVREAMKGGSYTFHRPTTAGAFAFEAWSLAQDESTSTKKSPRASDIQAGDIVISKFSHIGFAVGSPVQKKAVRAGFALFLAPCLRLPEFEADIDALVAVHPFQARNPFLAEAGRRRRWVCVCVCFCFLLLYLPLLGLICITRG